jgi:hypothetical protein
VILVPVLVKLPPESHAAGALEPNASLADANNAMSTQVQPHSLARRQVASAHDVVFVFPCYRVPGIARFNLLACLIPGHESRSRRRHHSGIHGQESGSEGGYHPGMHTRRSHARCHTM